MQVSNSIRVWESEAVTASVALRVLFVDSGNSVEWLVDVSYIMDEKSQGHREALVFRHVTAKVLHDHFELVIFGITGLLSKPLVNSVDGVGNVPTLGHEVVIADVTALVEIGGIHEVPRGLESAASSFDVIAPGGALDEGVFLLVPRLLGHGILKSAKNLIDLFKDTWVDLLQVVLGNLS